MSPSVSAVSAYDIVKTPAITVDGDLSEWANIAAISMAGNSGRTSGVDNTAKVKLAWDDTYLYAAYDVTDTELLAVQTTRDAADIFKDDEVELYIDPQGDGASASSMTATDYQLLANVRDAMGDVKGDGAGGKDASYNAASLLAKAATNGTLNVTGTDVGYTVELRISWSDLGVTPAVGHFMRIDPAVGDRDADTPPVQAFDWANLATTYNNPSAWKDVQLVDAPPPPSDYDVTKVASMAIDGNLSDWAGIPAVSMTDDDDRGAETNSATVKLAWNDTYLYAAYDVSDTELLAVQTGRDAADIYKDDEVELYLDPQGDGQSATSMTATDYQFLANVRDAIGDFRGNGSGGKDGSYNAGSYLSKAVTNGTLNATGTDAGYQIELRIAWSDLGVTPSAGHVMGTDLAVGDRDGSGPPPVNVFDWARLTTSYNNPSAWKRVRLADGGGTQPSGIPFGPFDLWATNTTIEPVGTASFNLSQGPVNSGNILDRIQAARDLDQKLILAMTGGNHSLYLSPTAPPGDSVFDRSKWNAKMQTFNTQAIKNAVADAVADGVIVGNSMVDEPNNKSWRGSFTKAILDDMATYAHNIFPTLPMGVNGTYTWRSNERYHVVDYANHQYSWRLPDGDPGNITRFRDEALAQDAADGVVTVFSFNVLGGGYKYLNNSATVKYQDCPDSNTGGPGDGGQPPNCKMTAQQVRDYGLFLGPAGAGLTMWEYEEAFFGRSDNKISFAAIAADLSGRNSRSWFRP